MFTVSFWHLKSNNVISIFKNSNNKYSNNLENYLVSIKSYDNIFSRIYISENVFKDINYRKNIFYKINNIYSPKDFTKFNLNILNVTLKNSSNDNIRIPEFRMYNLLYPVNKEIESRFLMNFYQIKFLFIYEDELKKIDASNFIVEKKFVIDEKKLLILRNLDFGKYQYEIEDYNDLSTCNEKVISLCLLNDKKKFQKNNKIKIFKTSNNRIEIKNFNDRKINLLLPFVEKNLWNKDDENLIYEKFKLVNLDVNEKLVIDNKSFLFIINKLIMIFTLITFTHHVFFLSKTQ